MTDHEPIEINGTTFEPVPVECPECAAEIDAQRAFVRGKCPECETDASDLCASDSGEAPPEDYEPECYKPEA